MITDPGDDDNGNPDDNPTFPMSLTPTSTNPDDNSWHPLDVSERRALPGAVARGRTNPHAMVELALKLRRKRELADSTQRPAVPLSHREVAREYGASKKDIELVAKTFDEFGLEVVSTDKATRTVVLRGSVSAVEHAFNVTLFDYSHFDGDYRGRVGPLFLPKEVGDVVVGVFGLDNRRVAHRRRHPVRNMPFHLQAPTASRRLPKALASHYNFPEGDGANQTIGLLEFGGGYFEEDMLEFCKLAGVPAPRQVSTVSIDAMPTNAVDGAEGEVMLDAEIVAGFCPQANIVIYFAPCTEKGWLSALDHAIHDETHKPSVLSISWGYAEDAGMWTRQAMIQANETLKEAALLGITVCVAAGDDGSSDGILDGHRHVDFPASSPFVLAVGGTTIPAGAAPLSPNIVWKEGSGLRDEGGGSTGGGVSKMFAMPKWQVDLFARPGLAAPKAGRCIPDLAANADWTASPYLLVVDGKAQSNGGTSAASPLVASLIALINAKRAEAGLHTVGYLAPTLYKVGKGGAVGADCCVDVTSGDNNTAAEGGYQAGQGYDPVSGWGTPNGKTMASVLSRILPD